GLPTGARTEAALDMGLYDPSWTERTYDALVDRARHLLGHGESVVLDASWLDPAHRHAARAPARETTADLAELRCVLPPDVAAARAAARAEAGGDVSDAGPAVARALAERATPWPEAVEIHTDTTPEAALAAALEALD